MPKSNTHISNDRSAAKNSAIEQAALGTTAAAMALGILASERDPARAAPNPHDDHRNETADSTHTAAPAASAEPEATANPPSAAHTTSSSQEPVQPPDVTSPGALHFGDGQHAEVQSPAAIEPIPAAASVDAAPISMPVEASSAPSIESMHGAMSGGGSASSADASPFQIDMPGLHSSVSDLGANITTMVNATLDAALTVPTIAVGHLVDAVFQSTPLPVADTPLIDATPLIGGISLPAPLTLGFMGQAHQDGTDAHDGAFSALGLHHV